MPTVLLADFIEAEIGAILDEWAQFARDNIPVARSLPIEVLRDHGRGILLAIVADLKHPQTDTQQEKKSKGQAPRVAGRSQAQKHGSARELEGFSINDAVAEFRALRASVLRLWDSMGAANTSACQELTRFNEAIDQALTESLEKFSAEKARFTRLFDTLLSASPDLSFILDLDGCLIYGNRALSTLFGTPLSAISGQRLSSLDVSSATQFDENLALVTSTLRTSRGEMCRNVADKILTYEYLLVPVIDEQGKIEAIAGAARDVTERKANELETQRRACYDQLTNLPNRSLFNDRLDREIKRSGRVGLPLALFFIDLDGFKEVNDKLGHEAGDELLRQSAQRIRDCVRESDTVARLGGDEFTVILTEVRDMPHVDMLARHILSELRRPFHVKSNNVAISCSIGIAIYPRDASDSAELLRHADQAMYEIKKAGRNRFGFFTSGMRKIACSRLKTIEELHEAMERHQLAVYYQPIIELRGGTVAGAEAQLRWQHPKDGLITAAGLVKLAEEAGLASEIDEWVLTDALTRARDWAAQRGAPLYVTVKKSTLGLTSNEWDMHWEAILRRLANAQAPVALEVTEAFLLSESEVARLKLTQLLLAGVALCVDDFGTGYSSITCLTKVPLGKIKIDMALVHGMRANESGCALVAAIIATAHALGLEVIAEGVETDQQKNLLTGMGCEYAQGFLFSAAVTPHRFAEILNGM